MSSASEMYRAERSKRVGRDDAAMGAARDELARLDAERAEKRMLRHIRCACGKLFDYIPGKGRPPINCPSCRNKPKTRALARIVPAETQVRPIRDSGEAPAKDVSPEPSSGNSSAPPHLTPRQFAIALRARLAALHLEREAVESLIRFYEADA